MLRPIKINDFKCPCCGEVLTLDAALHRAVNQLQAILGYQVRVLAGYYCPAHAHTVKDPPIQEHTSGQAVHIHCLSARARFLIIQAALTVGIKRIVVYPTYLHLGVGDKFDQDVIEIGEL